ncbi:MAG: hypothetical protein ACK52X_00790, partial [bacterium]
TRVIILRVILNADLHQVLFLDFANMNMVFIKLLFKPNDLSAVVGRLTNNQVEGAERREGDSAHLILLLLGCYYCGMLLGKPLANPSFTILF